MITAKLVPPSANIGYPTLAVYNSLEDAEKALSEDWPITTLRASNVIVMADYDGCRLILQRAR